VADATLRRYKVASKREQKLVDICFECVLTVLHPEHVDKFKDMEQEDKALWVARQLKECGFPTTPVGMSWGVLTNGKEDS
jgi:hypothetical protein